QMRQPHGELGEALPEGTFLGRRLLPHRFEDLVGVERKTVVEETLTFGDGLLDIQIEVFGNTFDAFFARRQRTPQGVARTRVLRPAVGCAVPGRHVASLDERPLREGITGVAERRSDPRARACASGTVAPTVPGRKRRRCPVRRGGRDRGRRDTGRRPRRRTSRCRRRACTPDSSTAGRGYCRWPCARDAATGATTLRAYHP